MAGSQFDPDAILRPKRGEAWFGSAKEPSGATRESTGRLHAEQHFEYHRPLVAGEVLTTVERDGETCRRRRSNRTERNVVLSASSLNVGDTRSEVVLENLSRTQIVMYAGLFPNDHVPTRREAARAKFAEFLEREAAEV